MHATASKRALHGFLEGALIGLAAAVVRAAIRMMRREIPEDLGDHWLPIAGYLLLNMAVGAYVFAVGRAIADGLLGSFLGTVLLALAGIYLGWLTTHAALDTGYPILLGGALGVVIGAPCGAWIQRLVQQKLRSGG